MALDLCFHTFVINEISENHSLRNETKNLLCEICVDHCAIDHNHDQRKIKIKGVNISVENLSVEERNDDLVWSEYELDDEAVENSLEPTTEEIENKMKSSLEN